MSKLLYIQASPRIARSHSIAVADAFVEAYRESHPSDTIEKMNLFEKDIPVFDGFTLQAKYAILHGAKHTPEEAGAWKAVEELIAEFKAADKYVMAVPMWNFSIPYRLKMYIDSLTQPGYTFSFSPEKGYAGLVLGKPIFIAYARGGEYPAGTPGEAFDLQKRYMELILGFIGFTDIRNVIVEPTLGAEPKAKEAEGIAKAKKMALEF